MGWNDQSSQEPSPRELGYRLPAEWERHQGTWISWPHNTETWPEELAGVEKTMASAVEALSSGETIHINVASSGMETHVRSMLGSSRIRFHHIPTNDAWVRDYGPIFVVGPEGELAATAWGFNSWGGKYPPFDLDDAAAARMAAAIGVPVFTGDIILEGGSIDVNGEGVLITTESCLLNPNRNPHLGRDEIEFRLRSYFGVDHIIWLRDGIVGDDTDGHVDDLTRFVDSRTIVTVLEDDRSDINYRILQENLRLLREARTIDGSGFDIIELPMPSPRVIRDQKMPASYANFYIGNEVVLVPVYGDPNDDRALGILRDCFPKRDVLGLDCTELIWGLGAFHCLTQQVPVAEGKW